MQIFVKTLTGKTITQKSNRPILSIMLNPKFKIKKESLSNNSV